MSAATLASTTRNPARQELHASYVDQAILELFSLPDGRGDLSDSNPTFAVVALPSPSARSAPQEATTDPEASASKSRVRHHEISRGTDTPPLRWVQIERPTESVLSWLAATFSIKHSDLTAALRPDRPAQSYRYGHYLVNSYAELSLHPSNPLKVTESRIFAILGQDFLITISPSESLSCRRVTEEIIDQPVESLDIGSSNHLFSRLLGSSLHANDEAVFQLEKAAETFSEQAATEGPTAARRAEYDHLKRSILDADQALQNNPEVILSLKEDRNLFGSPEPRAALARYEVIQKGCETRLQQANQFLGLIRDDWRITQDEHRNGILYRLAVLGGALSPMALAASLFGMNFPDGLPYTTFELALGMGASAAVSAVLVGALLFKQPFVPRRKKT